MDVDVDGLIAGGIILGLSIMTGGAELPVECCPSLVAVFTVPDEVVGLSVDGISLGLFGRFEGVEPSKNFRVALSAILSLPRLILILGRMVLESMDFVDGVWTCSLALRARSMAALIVGLTESGAFCSAF